MRLRIAGMLLLNLAACGQGERAASEPLRQAAFDVAAARAVVASCAGAAGRADLAAEDRRLDELRSLAAHKRADYPIWAGGNDYAALARRRPGARCEAGENGYSRALSAYRSTLDRLAREIAEHRQ